MSKWRAPYGDECSVILEWGKKVYPEKVSSAFIMGVMWTCMVLFISILFSRMTVRGKGWDSGWLIFACIIISAILFICGMIRFVNKKKLQMLAQHEYRVSEARVIDKCRHTGRYSSGLYLKIEWQNGSVEEYKVGASTYEQISFETNLIAIKYHDGMYGFFDQYDFVLVPK